MPKNRSPDSFHESDKEKQVKSPLAKLSDMKLAKVDTLNFSNFYGKPLPDPLVQMIRIVSDQLKEKIQPSIPKEKDVFSARKFYNTSIQEFLTRLVQNIEPDYITASEIAAMGIYMDRYLAATKDELTEQNVYCLMLACFLAAVKQLSDFQIVLSQFEKEFGIPPKEIKILELALSEKIGILNYHIDIEELESRREYIAFTTLITSGTMPDKSTLDLLAAGQQRLLEKSKEQKKELRLEQLEESKLIQAHIKEYVKQMKLKKIIIKKTDLEKFISTVKKTIQEEEKPRHSFFEKQAQRQRLEPSRILLWQNVVMGVQSLINNRSHSINTRAFEKEIVAAMLGIIEVSKSLRKPPVLGKIYEIVASELYALNPQILENIIHETSDLSETPVAFFLKNVVDKNGNPVSIKNLVQEETAKIESPSIHQKTR